MLFGVQCIAVILISIWKMLSLNSGSVYLDAAGGLAIATICVFALYSTGLLKKKNLSKSMHQVAFGIMSLVLSIMCFFAFGFFTSSVRYQDVKITVECGARSEEANSAEVWLSGWRQNGVEYSPSSLSVVELKNISYRAEYDSFVYTNSDSSGYGKIVMSFSGDGNNELVFNRHAWCGIVKISNNDSTEVVDLYHETNSKYRYSIPKGIQYPVWKQIGQSALYILLFYIFIEFAVLLVYDRVKAVGVTAKSLSSVGKRKVHYTNCLINGFVFALTSMCIPIIYLLFQFTHNPGEVSFFLVLGVCCVSAVIFLAFYTIILSISESAVVAYTSSVLFSLFMFASGFFRTAILQVGSIDDMAEISILICFGIAVLFVILCIRTLRHVNFDSLIAVGITVLTGFMLILNVPSAIQAYSKQLSAGSDNYVKEDYVIDKISSDAPNIYWFHCDGMLGFSAFEKYYGSEQSDFVNELLDYGFMINKNANFEAGHATAGAIPTLLCPDFYDKYLSRIIADETDSGKLHNSFDGPQLAETLRIARLNNETITAFARSDYKTAIIAGLNWGTTGTYYPPIAEIQYEPTSTEIYLINTDLEQTKALRTELSTSAFFSLRNFLYTLMLPMAVTVEKCLPKGWDTLAEYMGSQEFEKTVVQKSISDPINIPSTQALLIAMDQIDQPCFYVIPHDAAHNPFERNENGEKININSMDVRNYVPQHIYASKVLCYALNAIIERDPNAIIVIQADHGLHGNTPNDFAEAFGEDAVPEELWNCVISAIRVPEQYKNGEEKYAVSNPLNMSRYLVNRFVGRNYEYLPANESMIH